MGQRADLQTILSSFADNVYWQPPANTKMTYPCIVYTRDRSDTEFADNSPYSITKRYEVTVIDRNKDSVIPDMVARLPSCVHSRFFVTDNLNHDVFTLYF